MVDTWSPPQVSVPTDVSAHCDDWPKWVWMCHLPWPKGATARTRSIGGTHHHGSYQSQLHMPGHWWAVPGHLSAMQASLARQIWGGNRRAALLRGPRFNKGTPQAEEASGTAREGTGTVGSWYPLAGSSYGLHHHKPLNLWDDGPCPGCPTTGPCSSSNSGGANGEDEVLHQLLALR